MIIFNKDISRRSLLKWATGAAGAALLHLEQADAKKKKKKHTNSYQGVGQTMSQLRALLPIFSGAPAGTYTLPNSRLVTDNVVLEYDDGSFHTVPYDEYDVAWKTGYLVRRSKDNDQNAVDWASILPYPFYWSGRVISADGTKSTPVTREAIEWYQENNPTPMIDNEGRVNLELAYNALIDFLITSNGFMRVEESGIYLPTGTSIRYVDPDNGGTVVAQIVNSGADIFQIANASGTGSTGIGGLQANNSGSNNATATIEAAHFDNISDDDNGQYQAGYSSEAANYRGMAIGDAQPALSDGVGVDVNGKLLRLRTSKTPSSSADTGNTGEWCGDDDYIYRYTSTGWKRAALSSF